MAKLALPNTEYNVALVDGSAASAAKAAGTKESKTLMVPFDSINILEDFNVRVTGYAGYENGIKSLMASIRENGFYRSHPLSAKVIKSGDDDVYVLNDGHRRFEAVRRLREAAKKAPDGAALLAALERLPVVLKDAGSSLIDLTVELVTGNSGEALNPYEKALVVGRLISHDLKIEDIATRLGMTPRYVNDLKTLLGADEKMVENIVTGKVSGTEAIRLLREEKKGEGSAAEAVEAAAGEGGKATRAKTTRVKAQKTAKETAEMTFKAEQILGADAKIAIDVAKFLGLHDLLKATKGGQKAVKGFKVTVTVAHKVAVDTPAPAADDSGLNNDEDPAADLNNEDSATKPDVGTEPGVDPDAEAAGL